MKPVLDENKPIAIGDEGDANALGRMGSANFHSDSGDDASTSLHHVGISLHGDTVSDRGHHLWQLSQPKGRPTYCPWCGHGDDFSASAPVCWVGRKFESADGSDPAHGPCSPL